MISNASICRHYLCVVCIVLVCDLFFSSYSYAGEDQTGAESLVEKLLRGLLKDDIVEEAGAALAEDAIERAGKLLEREMPEVMDSESLIEHAYETFLGIDPPQGEQRTGGGLDESEVKAVRNSAKQIRKGRALVILTIMGVIELPEKAFEPRKLVKPGFAVCGKLDGITTAGNDMGLSRRLSEAGFGVATDGKGLQTVLAMGWQVSGQGVGERLRFVNYFVTFVPGKEGPRDFRLGVWTLESVRRDGRFRIVDSRVHLSP